MKKRTLSILLILVMLVCFGIAAIYPIKYFSQKESNEKDMADLRAMRMSALDDNAGMEQTDSVDENAGKETPPMGGSVSTDAAIGGSTELSESDAEVSDDATAAPANEQDAVEPKTTEGPASDVTAEPAEVSENEQDAESDTADEPVSEATQEPAEASADDEVSVEAEPSEGSDDRRVSEGYALPYPDKEHIMFDEAAILPQYREIYELNNDLVGWLCIPGTVIDYPVVRNADPDYYLDRDFYGEPNSNGQLILDAGCDLWTPSYNLVISGHNMKSGAMFAQLINYKSKSFWQSHKTFTFDSVMREGTYVVFAAFYSADYAEDEEGFRYNADVQYRLDAELWLEDIMENCEYETGIDVEFGDEFLTLTTCQYHREDGRFVVVARRVREGEVIE